jgi:hypothetical protein
LTEIVDPGQSCGCHSKIELATEKGNNIQKNFSFTREQRKATVG